MLHDSTFFLSKAEKTKQNKTTTKENKYVTPSQPK
jgi:hypothetical protein